MAERPTDPLVSLVKACLHRTAVRPTGPARLLSKGSSHRPGGERKNQISPRQKKTKIYPNTVILSVNLFLKFCLMFLSASD